MFEAKLLNGNILKKIVEAIKDVVNDVNIDVSPSGILPLAYPNHSFRSLTAGYGRFPCRVGLSKSEHGGIWALPRWLANGARSERGTPLKGDEAGGSQRQHHTAGWGLGHTLEANFRES